MIPQIIVIVSYTIGIFAHMFKHGEPQNLNYNLGFKLATVLISSSILYWGGFFDCFNK